MHPHTHPLNSNPARAVISSRSTFYISTKYHQNILKGISVAEQRQEIKFKHKKGR